MNPTKTLVAVAVLGLLAGATACGSGQSATGARPTGAATPNGDKNTCGNHPGSACAAVSAPTSPK